MYTAAIALAFQLLPTILQGTGVISPTMGKLISDLGVVVPTTITALSTPGASVPDTTVVFIKSLRAELLVLQADTTIAPDKLQIIATLLESIDAAIDAYEAGNVTDDPTTLKPLPVNV